MVGTVSQTTTRTTADDDRARRAREAAAQARRIQAQRAQTQNKAPERTTSTTQARQDSEPQDSYARVAKPAKSNDWIGRLGSAGSPGAAGATGTTRDRLAWPGVQGDIRLGANAGTSFTSLNAASSSAASATPIPEDKQDLAEEALSNAPPNPSLLANQLRAADGDPELRRALIKEAFEGDRAQDWLTGPMYGSSRKGQLNEGYDDMTEIATAVNEAYTAGDITDDQLRGVAEDLGPDGTSFLVQELALGRAGGNPGGVMEAIGEQAESLGYDEAAALAFTSTDRLLDAHYPTDEAQREAFGHVQEFIERYDQDSDFLESSPLLRNAVGSAMVNAARLTANGNGYSQEELDEEMDELGPTLAGEAIAQAGERPYNNAADGPLDVLGDSASRLGDDWKVNAAIAYTQSPQLLEANLDTEEKRNAAFDTLNGYLAEGRGEWSLAADEDYSLVRLPQAVEGMNTLLEQHPEMITDRLDGGPEGEADLVQLFESVSLMPDAPQVERDRLTNIMNDYAKDQLASVEPGNANEVGSRVGRLFGLMQVASNRAIDDAEADDGRIRELAVSLAAGVGGGVASAALTGALGPLGGAVGGPIVYNAINQFFHEDPPRQSEVEDAFADRLRDAGIDVSAGEAAHDDLTSFFGDIQDSLTAAIADPANRANRDDLQTQLNVINGLLDGFNIFGDTLDSGEGGGELNTKLNDRGDDP